MSRSHRLAWAAGFIDGDGFITIQNRNQTVNGKQYKGHYLRIGACQASLLPLEELKSLFGGTIREKNSGPNKEGYNRKQQWIWQCSTSAATDALKQLLPFLIHKKTVAEIALVFQETMGTTTQVSQELYNLRENLKQQIKELNSLD